MAREDLLLAPESLETLAAGLGDLGAALGPGSEAGLAQVRGILEAAIAAQRRGDRAAAVAEITRAMGALAELATRLDSAEAAAMAALAKQFEGALRGGDDPTAAQSIERMRARSGAVKRSDTTDL
jgi:hypothetical protein